MKWFLNALTSSLGRKFVMAITGLLLCGFLVAHLAGNLLLLDAFGGAKAYNEYAHALHSREGLLMVAETGLFALFFAHITIALKLTASNRLARSQSYLVKKSKREDTGGTEGVGRPDTWMFWSGAVLFAFLILHLIDFKFQARPDVAYEGLEPAETAVAVLKTPLSIIGYLTGFVFLFAHLSHGVSSAFQSLGVNHPKYNKLIKLGGLVFAGLIAFGFAVVLAFTAVQPLETSTGAEPAAAQPAAH